MANVQIIDGAAAEKYMKATGAGTAGDPYIVEHKETNAVAILAAAEAVQAATEAAEVLLTTIDGRVDGLEALLTTIDADTGNIATSVGTLDNAISGSEMQVDIVAALPAGTNLLGRESSSLETSTIYNGTTALTPKFAIIDAASSGNNTLVAAVTAKKIRVLSVMLVASGTVNVRFESAADGTALTGQMQLTAQAGFTLPFSPVGWFETVAEELLNLELSGATSVDGCLVYIEV